MASEVHRTHPRGADPGLKLLIRNRNWKTIMKVVLFCGGLGTRMRDYSETIPKPMVPIGYRPIIWHVMKYYAHYGHKDFILCLGYKADVIKNYFRNFEAIHRIRGIECASATGRAEAFHCRKLTLEAR